MNTSDLNQVLDDGFLFDVSAIVEGGDLDTILSCTALQSGSLDHLSFS